MIPRTSILVRHERRDDWHVFSSDELPGLLVASQNPELAFNDVAPAIQQLLLLDRKIKCSVESEMTFREFLDAAEQGTPKQRPAPLPEHRFAVLAQ